MISMVEFLSWLYLCPIESKIESPAFNFDGKSHIEHLHPWYRGRFGRKAWI